MRRRGDLFRLPNGTVFEMRGTTNDPAVRVGGAIYRYEPHPDAGTTWCVEYDISDREVWSPLVRDLIEKSRTEYRGTL